MEELYHHYREMSKAAGAKKPSESQKAKALWVMKAAKDRRDEFYDSAAKKTKTFWQGNKQNWSCGQNISKTQPELWTKL